MGFVIFGHGGLTPTNAAKMETCAVGTGTTLQFFADAGQALLQERSLLDMFGRLQKPWPPIDQTGVTYNLGLEPFSDAEHAALTSTVQDWAGHTLLTVGKDLGCEPILCAGDPTTCPRDPRMLTGAVAGPTKHTCNGILGKYAGQELFWVACSVIVGFDDETQAAVTAARGDNPENVLIGTNPDDAVANALQYASDYPDAFPGYFDGLTPEEQAVLLKDPGLYAWNQGRATTAEWYPSDTDLQTVSSENQRYVKDLDEDTDAEWAIGGFLLLLGDQHGYADWVRGQQDYAHGTFQVARATFGAGKLVFTGVPPAHEGTIKSMVEQFSDKSVKFQ